MFDNQREYAGTVTGHRYSGVSEYDVVPHLSDEAEVTIKEDTCVWPAPDSPQLR